MYVCMMYVCMYIYNVCIYIHCKGGNQDFKRDKLMGGGGFFLKF